MKRLSTTDHRRDLAGLTYIYPVLSRRAGGISIGINLNPNNACNWRCLYCQVEGLRRGRAPEIDWALLKRELQMLAEAIASGAFFREFQVPEGLRALRDVALSGNGEPTTYRPFDRAVGEILEAIEESPLPPSLARTIISNGSQLSRPDVQRGLLIWGEAGGQLWFKLDRATSEELLLVNGVRRRPEAIFRDLALAARLCPTWIQSCLFALDGKPPDTEAYLQFLADLKRAGVPIAGVQLYGVARPPRQPGSERISPLPASWFRALAGEISRLGFRVAVAE